MSRADSPDDTIYAAVQARMETEFPRDPALHRAAVLATQGAVDWLRSHPDAVPGVVGAKHRHFHWLVLQRHEGVHPPRGRWTRGWHVHLLFRHEHEPAESFK